MKQQSPCKGMKKGLLAAICISLILATPAAASWGTSDDNTVDRSDSSSDEVSTIAGDYVTADEAAAQRQREKDQAEQEKLSRQQQKAKYEDQISDLQSELDKLKDEQKNMQSKIQEAAGQKQQQQAIKSALDADLNNVMAQVDALNRRIDLLNRNIELTEEEISLKKKDINESILLLRKRILTSYKTGYSNALSVVLGADTYYDSLVRTKVISQISASDQELIDKLGADKAALEEEEASLKSQQEQLSSDKAELELSKQELNKKIIETNAQIENISKLEQEYQANLNESKQKAKEMEAEISNVYAQIANLSSSATSEYVGGEMAWPLPGFSTISSPYGWRFNNTDFHTGIDITGSGCMGHNIVAANTGTVVKANLSFTPGRGYGKYVIIDHGGGMTTLYGHCSSLSVSEGDVVARGQVIAQVGTTGWSTGPHLHFEIRKDGSHTNPLPYLKG